MRQCNIDTLNRFRQAQMANDAYKAYYREAQQKEENIPWKWFVFPCFDTTPCLFHKDKRFLQNRNEAVHYWGDPVLRQRLCAITDLILQRDTCDAFDIFGTPDYLMVHSCITLFYLVGREQIFKEVLDKFYGGVLCEFTVWHVKPRWERATDILMRKI